MLDAIGKVCLKSDMNQSDVNANSERRMELGLKLCRHGIEMSYFSIHFQLNGQELVCPKSR